MAVGVVVALVREARIVDRVLGRLAATDDVTVCVSGMGGERAADAARLLVRGGAQVLLSAGFAGALDERMVAGDLVVPDSVRDDTLGVDHRSRAAHALREALSRVCPLHGGALVSVATLVASAADKRALGASVGALSVDMESAAVAAVADDEGVDFAVVRAVSDAVDLELPAAALDAVGSTGHVDGAALAKALLRRPREVAALLRLAAGSRRAARTLERALPVALGVLRNLGAPHERC